MVMLETYYHLAEKDISRVSSIWKVGHVTLLAAIAISGFITAYTFGNTLDAFGNHCIIFSNVKLVERNVTDGTNDANATVNSSTPARFFRNDNETLTISLKKTVWGSDAMCSFCQFTPVMSMIFALSWGVFFTICSRGGSGYPSDIMVRPWQIVYPALFFSAIFACVLLGSTTQLTKGIDAFCKQLEFIKGAGCTPEINEYTLTFHKVLYDFYTNAKIAVAFAYIGLIAWFLQTGLLLLRILCITDFQLYLVSIVDKHEDTVDKVPSASDDDTSAQIDTQLSAISVSSAPEQRKSKPDGHKKKTVLFGNVKDPSSDDEWTEMSEISNTDLKENLPLHKDDQVDDSTLSK